MVTHVEAWIKGWPISLPSIKKCSSFNNGKHQSGWLKDNVARLFIASNSPNALNHCITYVWFWVFHFSKAITWCRSHCNKISNGIKTTKLKRRSSRSSIFFRRLSMTDALSCCPLNLFWSSCKKTDLKSACSISFMLAVSTSSSSVILDTCWCSGVTFLLI